MLLLALMACSGSGGSASQDAGVIVDSPGAGGGVSGGGVLGGGVSGAAPGAGGATGADARWTATITGTGGNPGYSGTLTLDEYDWGVLGGRLGVIQIDIAAGTKRRFLEGSTPSRHPSGETSFLQPCGTSVNRVALADARGIARTITGCSSELPQPADYPTRFGFSRLSPDAGRIAVEVVHEFFLDGIKADTAVYDLAGARLAEFDGLFAPAWAPDGRLILAGEGLYLADADLSTPQRIDAGALTGPVNNPAVHPDGTHLVFEYNQGIWEMNLDGSGLRERVFGPSRLRYPTYSPDGRALVYLGLPTEDYYDKALYFAELEREGSYAFDLRGIIGSGPGDVTIVPNGPLSWVPEE